MDHEASCASGYPERMSVLLAMILGCSSPSSTAAPAFVDGERPLVLPAGTPVGHYLGPEGLVASGVLEEGAPFILFEHTLFVGHDCVVKTYRWGEPVDLRARSLTVLEAPGWHAGTRGEASWSTKVLNTPWTCDPKGPTQILRLPGQPAIGWSAAHLAVVTPGAE